MPIDIVVLAGGKSPEWFDKDTAIKNKCLIPIHGKPVLYWVLRALQGLPKKEASIHLIGTASIVEAGLDKMADHFILVPEDSPLSTNVKLGIEKTKEDHLVFLSGDIPSITIDCIRSLLQLFTQYPSAQLILPIILKQDVERRFPGSQRTYAKIREGYAKVGNSILLQRAACEKILPLIDSFTNNRKSLLGLAWSFGIWTIIKLFLFKQIAIQPLEKAFYRKLQIEARGCLFPYAEIAVDLDKMSDYKDLEKDGGWIA